MTTSPYMFADLSSAETQGIIEARLAAAMAAAGQPTGSWAPSSVGGIENLRMDMVSAGLAEWMAKRYAAAVRGRLLMTAEDDPQLGYFLTYLGKKNYQLTPIQPTSTIQRLKITASTKASAAAYTDGQLWAQAPSTGNKYRLTLPAGQSVQVTPGQYVYAPFTAENPGAAYADPFHTITQLVTAKAGLSVTNEPLSAFQAATSTGASTGNVTASYPYQSDTIAKPTYSVLRVRIETTGNVGIAYFSTSVDGGLTWMPGGVANQNCALPGVPEGAITFFNGATSPSFVAGSVFSIVVDSEFIQRGRDLETSAQFQRACSNRWLALSLVPVRATIELWARMASAEVTKVISRADPNTPGGILVTLASQTGPASPGAMQAVQAFIAARLGFKNVPAPTAPTVPGSLSPEESVLVSSAQDAPVVTTGSVYVPRAKMDAAIQQADEEWEQYVDQLPMGGARGALVELARFRGIVGDAGAVDVQNLLINGAAADYAVPYAFDAIVTQPISSTVNWVPV